MDYIQLLASILSGGLSGGSVSTFFNHRLHWRKLRGDFYPNLNNIVGAYVIRMEFPHGRYLVMKPGRLPGMQDQEFVEQRSDFISSLVEFNELKEARELRRKMLDNIAASGSAEEGGEVKIELMPEWEAIKACMEKVHKKLKL